MLKYGLHFCKGIAKLTFLNSSKPILRGNNVSMIFFGYIHQYLKKTTNESIFLITERKLINTFDKNNKERHR